MNNSPESALPKRIHVIGICGVAMSAVAIAFKEKGVTVTGSDKGFFPPVSTELEKHGINFYAGWHPDKMVADDRPDLVIVGAASGTKNPETLYAEGQNIPRYSYPEILGKYFIKENSIVCTGTWGKTSSTALLSHILDHAFLDPTYMFGGISLSHGSSARIGNGNFSVLEGDEYKSSPTEPRAKFFHYRPTHLLLTAVSWDHADLYPTESDYFNAFKKLLEMLSPTGLVLACIDNPGVKETLASYAGKVIKYGRARFPRSDLEFESRNISPEYSYENAVQTRDGLELTISHNGNKYRVHSPMLGLYQSENITGCFAMARELGVATDKIIAAINSFKGLKRRLEKRSDGDVTVFDDIAHSPEKASAVLQTLKSTYTGDIIAIFEPNMGGRSRESLVKYKNAFADADTVIIPRLTKLKTADNESNQPIDGAELATIIFETHPNVKYIEDDADLVKYLISQAKKGDAIVFLGAHGFRGMIEEIVKLVR